MTKGVYVKFLVLLLAMVVAAFAMSLPERGTTPAEAVPFETVQELALRKAAAEWPGCRLGTVLPCVDEDGATTAYLFHFTTDGSAFPDYQRVAADIRAERERLGPNTDLTRWRSKYACLMVSARRDRTPIVYYGYGTSEYYAVGGAALERAQQVLGSDARLSRLYFLYPVTCLEFAAGNRHVIYSSHFEREWRSRSDFAGYVDAVRAGIARQHGDQSAAAKQVYRREWDEALRRDFSDFSEVFVPNAELAPFYDWSYGCTPTAAAMVVGWMDRTQDCGRLVEWFFQRRDMVEGENDWQIPNVQRECALEMHTDTTSGGTSIGWIAPGLENLGDGHGYDFTVIADMGGAGNDWCWATVTSEIDAGYDMVWSALWEIHSLAAYGYRTPQKDVYVHNTWWMPAGWWHYSGSDIATVAAPHAGAFDQRKLRSLYPKGDTNYNSTGRGEVFQVGDTVTVLWENGGNPGSWVAIDLSRTGGRSWTRLDSVPDTGSYTWVIDPAQQKCDSVRLRLRQWLNGTYQSGDGTFGCFRLIREPLPPLQLSPPNGRQLFSGPVILLVDTTLTKVDSFEFKIACGTDTIWREKTVVPRCSLPDSLFIYGRSYKWFCRGHNVYGWGEFGTPWTFWCKFNQAVAENPAAAPATRLSFPTVVPTSAGRVSFGVRAATAQARIEVFDAAGQRVATMPAAGAPSWEFGSSGAGLYFVRLWDGTAPVTRKLLLTN